MAMVFTSFVDPIYIAPHTQHLHTNKHHTTCETAQSLASKMERTFSLVLILGMRAATTSAAKFHTMCTLICYVGQRAKCRVFAFVRKYLSLAYYSNCLVKKDRLFKCSVHIQSFVLECSEYCTVEKQFSRTFDLSAFRRQSLTKCLLITGHRESQE